MLNKYQKFPGFRIGVFKGSQILQAGIGLLEKLLVKKFASDSFRGRVITNFKKATKKQKALLPLHCILFFQIPPNTTHNSIILASFNSQPRPTSPPISDLRHTQMSPGSLPTVSPLTSSLYNVMMNQNNTPTTQPNEEISTIFVVGFPDDMQEREFQNMFIFSPGFEAATLKVPSKDQEEEMGLNTPTPSNPSTNLSAMAATNAANTNARKQIVSKYCCTKFLPVYLFVKKTIIIFTFCHAIAKKKKKSCLAYGQSLCNTMDSQQFN